MHAIEPLVSRHLCLIEQMVSRHLCLSTQRGAGRTPIRRAQTSALAGPDGIFELVPDVVASQHARWRCPAGKHVCVVAGFHEHSQRERRREEGGGRRGRLGEAENGACQRKNKESRGRGARAVERTLDGPGAE